MNAFYFHVQELLFFIGLGALLFIGGHTRFRLGRRRPTQDSVAHLALFGLQGSLLGLVGLLLAFSFSLAISRYEQRRHLVVEEANAIGTVYLRTAFYPGSHADRLRRLLREYV